MVSLIWRHHSEPPAENFHTEPIPHANCQSETSISLPPFPDHLYFSIFNMMNRAGSSSQCPILVGEARQGEA